MNFVSEMPEINLEVLKQELSMADFEIAKGIISTRGKNKGRLRASKPPVAKMIKVKDDSSFYGHSWQFKNDADLKTGLTAYVWRMVAFSISPISQHHCMPCTADFNLPGSASATRELSKKLDDLADKIVNTVPKEKWYDVQRWSRVF